MTNFRMALLELLRKDEQSTDPISLVRRPASADDRDGLER